MTLALWCVLVAALLPYLAATIAKAGGERYDNRDPRAWLDRQQGFRVRANNTQQNGFEAFPFFAAAVIVAHMLQPHRPPTSSSGCSSRIRYRARRRSTMTPCLGAY